MDDLSLFMAVIAVVAVVVVIHFGLRSLWMSIFTNGQIDEFRGWVHKSGEIPGRASKSSWKNIFRSEVRSSGQSPSGNVPYFLNVWNWTWPCSVVVAVLILLAFGAIYLLVR